MVIHKYSQTCHNFISLKKFFCYLVRSYVKVTDKKKKKKLDFDTKDVGGGKYI